MLTASYLAHHWLMRPDYLQQEGAGHVGIDPIDAPGCIPAGSHYSYQTTAGNRFPMPSYAIRNHHRAGSCTK